VRNVSVAVREHKGEIVFLRRVVAGGANRSYGIDVARLAGLPTGVIARARQIMGQLEGGGQLGSSAQLSLLAVASPASSATSDGSAPIAAAIPSAGRELLDELAALDTDRMTPMAALAALAELADRARRG
jgi:DNA mismatch repair protein MutS